MPKLHIKKGDTVQVMAGESKGAQGIVSKVYPEKSRAIVEDTNDSKKTRIKMMSKHTKPNAASPDGGIVKEVAPIHISNLMVLDPKTGTPSKTGRKEEAGKKVRYAKKIRGGYIMSYSPRLKTKYKEVIVASLKEKFSYSSIMQVPKIQKICLNQGVGNAVSDKRLVDAAVEEMTLISGQKANATFSKKDISNFKLRKGMPIGSKVTLRGDQMYEFLDRLVAVALPRTRDFRGIEATGFDGRGNYTLGIKEQIIFPEIDIDKVKNISGMDITIVTSAQSDDEGKALLTEFGLPFKKK
jgi:large subunit ribosomal protein L5